MNEEANRPKNIKIIEDIKHQIELGVYKDNGLLPSENELSEKYGVSRVTVQKALNILDAAGFIYAVPGKGTFAKAINQNLFHFQYDELVGFDVKLLSVDIVAPPPEVIYYLQVHPQKRVVCIKRTAKKNGNIAIYDVKYIPYYSGIPIIEAEINYSLFPDLVANLASPYQLIRELNVKGTRSEKNIADILDIKAGTPIVEVEEKLTDEDGLCIGWGRLYYRQEYFNIKAEKVKLVQN